MATDKSIKLRSELPEIARKELNDAGVGDLNVGDIFIAERQGEMIRINEIKIDDITGEIKKISFGKDTDWDSYKFSDYYGTEDGVEYFLDYLGRYGYVKVEGNDIAKWEQAAKDIIDGKASVSDYSDNDTNSVNSETAIMSKGSKESLLVLQDELNKKKNKATLVANFVGREMERKRQELENIKKKMYALVADFKDKIKKVMRVITTIEIYLGIEEELFCLQEGAKADVNTPITFRQAVLYMDEEIGHWEDGGLDFQDIKWFDEFLVKDDNYKRLFPEEKGMVVFRPRRFKKDYRDSNHYANALKNDANINSTYLLIRNGECLYRVFTEKVVILPRLFPKKKELQQMFDDIQKATKENSWKTEEIQEEFEESMSAYKHRAALMQGLIDRSEVFHPLPCAINIFNLEETKDLVNFVYDDEATLPSGRLSFKEWKDKINSTITHGSRILLTGEYSKIAYSRYYDKRERLFYHCNEHNVPRLPQSGLYEVTEQKVVTEDWLKEDDYQKLLLSGNFISFDRTSQDRYIKNPSEYHKKNPDEITEDDYIKEYRCKYNEPHLRILYNPKDTVYGSWGDYDDAHERKKRIGWKIYPDDEFVLNYDNISLDDIEFYLTSRVDRPNYLEMMPILVRLKEMMLAEQAKEAPFIQLLVGSISAQTKELSMEEVENRVVRCIDWWKHKNTIKRPIDKNDVLAIRMIEKRVLSKNYHKLNWDY